MNLYAWRCPSCRDAVPGLYTPRDDNPCRFCVGCSKQKGEIVKRFRDELYGGSAKTDAPTTIFKGYDLQEELLRLTELDCVRDAFPHHKPRLRLRHHSASPKRIVGQARFRRQEIIVALWPQLSAGGALSTLAHEVAHLAVGEGGHKRRWRSAYAEIVREGYGIRRLEVPPELRGTIGGLDVAVECALDAWVASRGSL